MLDELVEAAASRVTYAPHMLGSKFQAGADCPPRFVWVPRSHSYRDPIMKGAIIGPTPQAKRLYAKIVTLDVHCWGTDYAQCWVMEDLIAHALHEIMGRRVAMGGATWTNPEWADYGPVLSMSFSIDSTVLERNMETGEPLTPGLVGPPVGVEFVAGSTSDGVLGDEI